MKRNQFISKMAKLRPSSTFLTLLGYRNAYSEIADYNIVFHINYENALKRSLEMMKKIPVSDPIQIEAKQELISSFTRSLSSIKEAPEEDNDDVYTKFKDKNGKYIKGIKIHNKTGNIHLYGFVNAKRVILPGMYPDSGGSELAKAKRHLRQMVPVGKFRQFILTPDHLDHISVQGVCLTPPN